LPVTTFLLGLVSQLGDVVEKRVRPHDSEGDIDIEEGTSLLHDESGIKSWPHFDVVGVERVGFGRIEGLGTDGLELESSHH